MDDRVVALREALSEIRAGRVRWRCPGPLRSEVIGYVCERRSEGSGLAGLAAELGLSESTLQRWLQKATAGFRKVRVVSPPASTEGLSLVTPRGYRLEGLTASEALQILRNL